jgi:hypothetical protein
MHPPAANLPDATRTLHILPPLQAPETAMHWEACRCVPGVYMCPLCVSVCLVYRCVPGVYVHISFCPVRLISTDKGNALDIAHTGTSSILTLIRWYSGEKQFSEIVRIQRNSGGLGLVIRTWMRELLLAKIKQLGWPYSVHINQCWHS